MLVGVLVTGFLAGCVGLSNMLSPPELPPQPLPHVQRDLRPTADELRIPGEAVTKANDIPVVPVPPVPLGQGNTPRASAPQAQPEIKQVSTLPPSRLDATEPATPKIAEPANLKQVVQLAAEAYGRIDSYTARLTRRETVGGSDKPEEVLLFKFRKEPWSVYFKWLSKDGQGREVVYVKGMYEDKIHTLLAAGDILLMPAGKRMSFDPNNTLVRSKSRHGITDAGMGASIDRLSALLGGDKRRGTLDDLGVQNRPDYENPLRMVSHTIPAGCEDDLPRGGKRFYGFDTVTRLPVLVFATDETGKEVEYYRYDRILMPGKLDDADFNPDKLWAPAATKTAQGKQ
jgi:hypothetical protein